MAILLKIPFPDTLPPWLLRQHSDWVPSLTDCSFSRSWLVHLLLDLLTLDSLRAQFSILFSSLSTFPYLISLVSALSKSLYRPMILDIYLQPIPRPKLQFLFLTPLHISTQTQKVLILTVPQIELLISPLKPASLIFHLN